MLSPAAAAVDIAVQSPVISFTSNLVCRKGLCGCMGLLLMCLQVFQSVAPCLLPTVTSSSCLWLNHTMRL